MEKIQELTEKLYREGVERGQAEAAKIKAEAEAEAQKILDNAREQAQTIEAQAKKKAAELDANTKGELKLYTSQALNALRSEITNVLTNNTVEEAVKGLVADPEFLPKFAVELASKWAGDGPVVLSTAEAENLRKYFAAKAKELGELESRYAWMKALSDTANGNITGKDKIMLETYVQMGYFDRILGRANVHLMKMSGGKYDLKRRKTQDSLRGQIGLDLDVIDHYNGTVRSVRSLSGGESFIASLSLALGMSEEVQSSSGGVRLDTMFVDEGFGSLDDETLQQAMGALRSLTESNRLVGIISHVGELKSRIDRQILVTKDRSGGSSARILG